MVLARAHGRLAAAATATVSRSRRAAAMHTSTTVCAASAARRDAMVAGGAASASTAVATAAAASRPAMPGRVRTNLLGMSMSDLSATLLASPLKLPAFRARQLAHWIYARGARDFAQMDNFSREHRARLDELFRIDYGTLVKESLSQDHTRKLLVGFESAKSKLAVPGAAPLPLEHIECVYIPMGATRSHAAPRSGAVCVSSQVGCSLTCKFCATGAMDKARLRNLTPAEIVGQVMHVKHTMGDFAFAAPTAATAATPSAPGRAVSNIVMMGMGEPLYNYRNVRSAIDVITSHPRAGLGLGLGRPRVTLSTSGVAPALDKLLEDYGGNISLAISLHAVNDALRNELVPINQTFNLSVLMEAVRRYQNGRVSTRDESTAADESDDFTASLSTAGRRRVTFEYVMLKGVNDSLGEARQMVRLLHGIDSLVNLIPFNPWEGSNYVSSDPHVIEAFANLLQEQGVKCTVRWPRGRDINGACGQLSVKHDPTLLRASA